MNSRDAKLLLQAYRPSGADEVDPAFAEALELAERDPELRAWWEAQRAFDHVIAMKLADVSVPESLRDSILNANPQVKTDPLTPQPKMLPWLAIAAAVAILCVAGTFAHVARFGALDQDDYAAAVLPYLKNDSPDLAMATSDRGKIAGWLNEEKAPMGVMPGKLATIPPVGCQKYEVHGHMVSLVCFQMDNGKIAHLFIVDRSAIEDAAPTGLPTYNDNGTWRTASWSDGKMSYLLATTSDLDSLKQLL